LTDEQFGKQIYQQIARRRFERFGQLCSEIGTFFGNIVAALKMETASPV
jgi:hypothetical protein